MRALLVSMPFATVLRPSLGVSLLKASLEREGVAADVVYPGIAFARLLSLRGYERLADGFPHPILAGEWVFTGCLYEEGRGPDPDYVEDVLQRRWRLAEDDVDLILRARSLAPGFLDACMSAIPWAEYDLVGFSSCGAQNVASLALARRVKAAHPGIAIAFGGSNWDEEMGAEYHRRFAFVDFGFSGEAERSLPALLSWLRERPGDGLAAIPGIVYRQGGRTVSTGPPVPVADLDTLPVPDFDDYFETLAMNGLARRIRPAVLVETCRGCWWADKHPCLFCGSPGCRRAFRRKSSRRVLDELRHLASRPGIGSVEIVDDVPPPEFFDDVLPALAADPLEVPLSCEVRPEATHRHIALLAAAGATIQPGIESLNDHILHLMHKGSRALENVRLLLWCRAHGVPASWNLIYGVPGETVADYEQMLGLLPALRFLDPPEGCGPVRLDRFSAYADRPAEYGLTDLAALTPYRYLYPFPEESLRRIAYAFEYSCAHEDDPWAKATRVITAVESWQSAGGRGEVRLTTERDGSTAILDTRDDARASRRTLDALEATVYRACADICRRSRLDELVAAACPDAVEAADIDVALDSFVGDRLMVRDGERYLSLALPPQDEVDAFTIGALDEAEAPATA